MSKSSVLKVLSSPEEEEQEEEQEEEECRALLEPAFATRDAAKKNVLNNMLEKLRTHFTHSLKTHGQKLETFTPIRANLYLAPHITINLITQWTTFKSLPSNQWPINHTSRSET